MSLVETVQQDLVVALKAKDTAAVSALRGLKAAMQLATIEAKSSLSEERALAVLEKEMKQREDSISTYTAAGRKDLANIEQAELAVLTKYQPDQLSNADLEKIIRDTVANSSVKDFGPLMGQVMAQVKGRADGKVVQTILKDALHV